MLTPNRRRSVATHGLDGDHPNGMTVGQAIVNDGPGLYLQIEQGTFDTEPNDGASLVHLDLAQTLGLIAALSEQVQWLTTEQAK